MNVVPKSIADRIQFYEVHNPIWADHAAEIGTSEQAVEELDAQTREAREAYQEQQQAILAARSATLRLRIAIGKMSQYGSAIIGQVRSKAASEGNGVYNVAHIPAPDAASPLGAPGQPYQLRYTLGQTGALKLTWTCDNPRGSRGTIYQIWRRIGFEGEFVYLGGSGRKRYVDTTVPPGARSIEYEIQAVRSTKVGTAARFIVNFGVSNPEMHAHSDTPQSIQTNPKMIAA